MKKNTCIAAKEWFEKKFLIIYGFACLFEITIFKYKIELKNILLALMSFCLFVCLFDLILYVHSTIFQLCGTGLPGLNQY